MVMVMSCHGGSRCDVDAVVGAECVSILITPTIAVLPSTPPPLPLSLPLLLLLVLLLSLSQLPP